MSNLRQVGTAFVLYNGDNSDCVIPSYNMTGIAGGAECPLDGWAPIMEGSADVCVPVRPSPIASPVIVEGSASMTGKLFFPKKWQRVAAVGSA